jgi:hypothetical protein
MDVVFVIDATGSMADTIQAAHDKACDLAFDLRRFNRTADFRFGSVCYRDPVDEEEEKHEVFDFTGNDEELADWLGKIEATGGGDTPEDFVGALEAVFTRLSWRPNSKRAVIWIADAPAHGRRFCEEINHQEEEAKLPPLVVRLARERVYVVGISLGGGADTTFTEMRSIYLENEGPSFVIESYDPEPGKEIDGIAATMMESTSRAVTSALADLT